MKIDLILLAAGNSSRFKGNKLLTTINHMPMYMNIVKKILNIGFNKIILVTQYEEIREAVLKYPIEVVMNYNSEFGIANSIKLGVQKSKNADGYMFMVCDQPFIAEDSIKALICRYIRSDKGLACVEYKGILGNPTIFSKKYKNYLINLKGDKGGKAIINRNLDDLVTVEIYDKFEIMDIDTEEELKKIKEVTMKSELHEN